MKPEEISESQTNDQKNHIHASSKRRVSQKTEKDDTMMGEDMKRKVILGKLNQHPHQPLNGVSRRKVSRRTVGEEEAAGSTPSITSITSHGPSCMPGSLAQQVNLQETGDWKETQEQLLRYQLAGQGQMLMLCPDLKPQKQQLQGGLCKDSGGLGRSQEKTAPCGATEAFCLHSVHPGTTQEQL
ncbi:Fibrocystin [Tupaia chinensis]|uniref:Fibrocystin n=2 Tax=Tupaia chinensis TaxID=246437 RepID=L8Y4G4_TUPCH|nr:Fibrocystin [Tupaia chinensis]